MCNFGARTRVRKLQSFWPLASQFVESIEIFAAIRPANIFRSAVHDLPKEFPREVTKPRFRAGRYRFAGLLPNRIWASYDLGGVALLLPLHRIASYWLEPQFLFKYYGFSWIHPWPGNGLYVHLVVLGLLALLIAAGFFYRISAALFFLGYSYIFLLDEAQWLNHTYLFCLFAFLLIFVPANVPSIDAWRNRRLRSATTPQWTLWLLRTQMAVVYFFAGVAKISRDWIHGEPMRVWLSPSRPMPIVGRFFREEWAVYGELRRTLARSSIVPFLLWRRTRRPAFCLALVFHILNARLFPPIGLFPWVSISGNSAFFPSWPQRLFSTLFVADCATPVVGD